MMIVEKVATIECALFRCLCAFGFRRCLYLWQVSNLLCQIFCQVQCRFDKKEYLHRFCPVDTVNTANVCTCLQIHSTSQSDIVPCGTSVDRHLNFDRLCDFSISNLNRICTSQGFITPIILRGAGKIKSQPRPIVPTAQKFRQQGNNDLAYCSYYTKSFMSLDHK